MTFGFFRDGGDGQFAQELHVMRSRQGVIGGVRFDLRHPDLRDSQWRCPQLLAWWGGPYRIVAPTAGGLLNPTPSETRVPTHDELAAGDEVFVADVIRQPIGDQLTHPADAEKRLALMKVRRADGGLEELTPLEFYARGCARTGLTRAAAFETLADRIAATFDVADIDDFHPLADWAGWIDEVSPEEDALLVAQEVRAAWSDLLSKMPDGGDGLLGFNPLRSALNSLVNRAVTFGFMVAEADADRYVRPVAARRLRDSEERRERRIALNRADGWWHDEGQRLWQGRDPAVKGEAVYVDIRDAINQKARALGKDEITEGAVKTAVYRYKW